MLTVFPLLFFNLVATGMTGSVGRDTEVFGDVRDLAISGDRLFVALSASSRVQAYSLNDGFLFGWNTDTNGGSFDLRSIAGGVEVRAFRRRMAFSYSDSGSLVGTRPIEVSGQWRGTLEVVSREGTRYRFRRVYGLFPRLEGRRAEDLFWVTMADKPFAALYSARVVISAMSLMILLFGLAGRLAARG
jgi:hypothetical protein